MFRGMNEVENIAVRAQSGFDARLLVEEAYDAGNSGVGNAMVRVINVEHALALLPAPPISGALTIEVKDEQIQENCGRFTIQSDGDGLTVTKNDGTAADMRCDIQGLSALVMGRHRFRDAVDAGLIELHTSSKMKLAELLFTERKLHMNRDF